MNSPMRHSFVVDEVICKFHIYKVTYEPVIGEVLGTVRETENANDPLAIKFLHGERRTVTCTMKNLVIMFCFSKKW